MPTVDNMGTWVKGPGTYSITKQDGVRVIAMKLTAGTANVQGSAKVGSFGASMPVPLVMNEPTVLSNQDPIDGLTLTIDPGSSVTIFSNQ